MVDTIESMGQCLSDTDLQGIQLRMLQNWNLQGDHLRILKIWDLKGYQEKEKKRVVEYV